MYKEFSERYYSTIDEYVDFHENGTEESSAEYTFLGSSLIKWVFHINNIIKETKSNSLIDFGCGKAMGYLNKITADDVLYQNVKDFWKIKDVYGSIKNTLKSQVRYRKWRSKLLNIIFFFF